MLDILIRITFTLFLFLLPLFVIPLDTTGLVLRSEGFDIDKQALFIGVTLFLLLCTVLKIIFGKKIVWIKTPLDFPLLVLAGTYVLSGLFAQNKIGAFTSPLGTTTILFLVLLYYLITHNITSSKWTIDSLQPLFISSSLLSILILGKEGNTGNTLSLFFFLLTLSILLASLLFFPERRKEKSRMRILGISSMLGVTSLATFSLLFHLFTDQKPMILPFSFGWTVLMEMGKNIQTFLLGVGPGNFLTAFFAGKPASFNLTPFWDVLFTSSSSFILTLMSEVGMLGFLAFVFLTKRVILIFRDKHYRNDSKEYVLPLTILLVAHYLFPVSLLPLILFIILLGYTTPKKEIVVKEYVGNIVFCWRYFLGIAHILLVFFLLYLFGRVYLADIFTRQARALRQSYVTRAYASIEQAIHLNPYSDSAYILASDINLHMPSTIDKKTSEKEREKMSITYIQKSIDYARKAVEVNPHSSENWAHLGQIYQLFMDRPDAQKGAFDAYNQQFLLDPTSPQPRFIMGKLLMSLGAYDRAFFLLNQAVHLKPNWNMPHHSLALLYTDLHQPQQAAEALQKALALTPHNTPEHRQFSKELENFLAPLSTESATNKF